MNKKLFLSFLSSVFLSSMPHVTTAQINLDKEFENVISQAKNRSNIQLGAGNVNASPEQIKQAIEAKKQQDLANELINQQNQAEEKLKLPPVLEQNQISELSQELSPQTKPTTQKKKSLPQIGSMEELLSTAYSNNPAVNSARIALKSVDEQYNQAIAGFLPRIDYNASRTREKTTPLGGVEDNYNLDSTSLNLSQPIFGGGETYYAIKAAKNRVLSARNELRNTEQQFLLDAIDSYINVIFTEKVLKLAENNQSVLEEQLRAVQERFVIGDATRTDVAQSEARLANAKSNRVIAEGESVNAKANFKRIFGSEQLPNLKMPETLPNIPESQEIALSRAANNNPQLNQLMYLVKSRDNDINVQRSQLFPQVDLRGSIADTETATSIGSFGSDSQLVGVNVRVPIYDAGITYSRTREARDRRDQTKQQLNDTSNQIKSLIVQAWQNIKTTASNIESTKSSLAASEYALDGVREEQKEGARTILDVLDAEQERFNAETNHARAIKDSVIAIYRLKFALGELTPEELGLSVASYNPEIHFNNTKYKLIGW